MALIETERSRFRSKLEPTFFTMPKENKEAKIKKYKEQKAKMENGYNNCSNKLAFDKRIRTELGLLMAISSLSAKYGYCVSSNLYLSVLFECSEETISRKLSKLEKIGYLFIEYKFRGSEIVSRKIIPTYIRNLPLTKTSTDHCVKRQPTIDESIKDKNTINKNTNINNTPLIPKGEREEIEEIFNNWNQIGCINHRQLTPEIEKAIKSALSKHSKEEINQSMLNYFYLLSSDNPKVWKYKWKLIDYLKKQRGKSDANYVRLMDGGDLWENNKDKL